MGPWNGFAKTYPQMWMLHMLTSDLLSRQNEMKSRLIVDHAVSVPLCGESISFVPTSVMA